MSELRHLAKRRNHLLEGEISIATTHSILQYYLPQFVSHLKKNYPQIKFKISGNFNHEILRKLELSEADLGLCSPIAPLDNYACLKLFETQYALIVNKNENLRMKRGRVTLDQISQRTFIHYNQQSQLRKIIESKFIERGLKIYTAIEVNHFETIKRYVELGLGVSIINSICLSESDQWKFKIIPMDQFFQGRPYYLVHRKRKYISPHLAKFIECLFTYTGIPGTLPPKINRVHI